MNEKKLINGTNANVAIANANANMKLRQLINASIQDGTLKKGAKGVKSEIYRKEIFDEMLDEEKKSFRRTLRKTLQGYIGSFKDATSMIEKEKIANRFWEFYTLTYTVNDFSINSIAGGRIDENTRKVYEKVLPEIKKILKK